MIRRGRFGNDEAVQVSPPPSHWPRLKAPRVGDDLAKPMTYKACSKLPVTVELTALGMRGFSGENVRPTILWFDLAPTDFYADWKGKLIVGWPPPERSWWRRAHRNDFPVLAILDESALSTGMPSWEDIVLTWEQLAVLPTNSPGARTGPP